MIKTVSKNAVTLAAIALLVALACQLLYPTYHNDDSSRSLELFSVNAIAFPTISAVLVCDRSGALRF